MNEYYFSCCSQSSLIIYYTSVTQLDTSQIYVDTNAEICFSFCSGYTGPATAVNNNYVLVDSGGEFPDCGLCSLIYTNCPTALPSPSPTRTPTPTKTPPATRTPTPTQTSTQTPGASPTSTPTNTPTNTVTPSNTSTVTPTLTPTNTPTNTVTKTPTTTPTKTKTPTPSVTKTQTPTNTSTSTVTPTNTPTNTPSNTPSKTPPVTPSTTPTNTPTKTTTPTNTPTNTKTPTRTPTNTPTNTVTRTKTPTPTPTRTTTSTPNASASPTPTNTPTRTQTPTNTSTRTQTPTNTPTRTVTPTVTRTSTQTPTNTPTRTLTPTVTRTPTPTKPCLISITGTSYTQKGYVSLVEDCSYYVKDTTSTRAVFVVVKDEFGYEMAVPDTISVNFSVYVGATLVNTLTVNTLPNQVRTRIPLSFIGTTQEISKFVINSQTALQPRYSQIQYFIGTYTVCTTTISPRGLVDVTPQTWMTENLAVKKLSNGDVIDGPITDPALWIRTTSPAWCYYNNDSSTEQNYGILYNWHAVNRGLMLPTGWRIPTNSDWSNLLTLIGGNSGGGTLKDTTFVYWLSPNTGANNAYRFAARGVGSRNGNTGVFAGSGQQAFFWSNTSPSPALASYYTLLYNQSTLRNDTSIFTYGYSVRALK